MDQRQYPQRDNELSEALFDARILAVSGYGYLFLGFVVIWISVASADRVLPALPLIASGLCAIPVGGGLIAISLRQCRSLREQPRRR